MPSMTTPSEEFVYRICHHTFLSLWSYVTPKNSDGNELCDILIVCDPDVVVISVKDIQLPKKNVTEVIADRWRSHAIRQSTKQISGAVRWLKKDSHVIRHDGSAGIDLPPMEKRQYHRVAVAFGGRREVAMASGVSSGAGFAHVFDEIAFTTVLRELDTIGDFVHYLNAKERFLTNTAGVVLDGGEEELLAIYLFNNRAFPSADGHVLIQDGIWRDLIGRKEYQAKQKADEDSYAWDNIIETFANNLLANTLEFSGTLSESEKALRVMARETRLHRRLLGRAFVEFLRITGQGKVGARIFLSPSGITYVYLALPHNTDRAARTRELELRCFVARGMNQDRRVVVGIATEQYVPNAGFSLDLVHLEMEDWSAENQQHMELLQNQQGYFRNLSPGYIDEKEYPTV